MYYVTQTTHSTIQAIEFQRISQSGIIKATNFQEITLSTEDSHPIRVLMQERHGALFEVAKELPAPTKLTPFFWIFESGFIKGLPWDPSEWHWQSAPSMGDAPFFGYSAKKGYRNARKCAHTLGIHSFIQQLNLQNSSVLQMITRIWHNSRPRKVGTLI